MAGVTASLALALAARLTGPAVGGGTPQITVDFNGDLDLEPGTNTLAKADILYCATRTLAGGANEDLDLAGVLSNAFGSLIAAAEVVVLLIEATTQAMRFGPAAVNGWLGPFNAAADRMNVKAGEYQLIVSKQGLAVVAGTGDKLNVLNTGGVPADYTITIIGRTVAA